MSYNGGKASNGVYHRLINLMPPHDRYIEPFLGGGAIIAACRRAACRDRGPRRQLPEVPLP